MTSEKLVNSLLTGLNPRQEEVIIGRFGLKKSQEPQTLAAIGERYGITRERVRQIEASSLVYLRNKIKSEPAALEIINRAQKTLKSAGGVLKKEDLLKELQISTEGLNENYLALLIEASGAFNFYSEDANFYDFYYLDKQHLKDASQFIDQLVKFLRPKKEDILQGKFSTHLSAFLKAERFEVQHANNFLKISKKIHTNPYGDTGLAVWPEIKPQTIRDRIYLILKKKGGPLHFRIIADSINDVGFQNKVALVPTVHNELIKDPRFILVGRGIYGLSEFGYEPGTAREVIQRILKKVGPLDLPQIIEVVQKERFFKPNTIIANLQNKNYFKKLDNGRYQIRES